MGITTTLEVKSPLWLPHTYPKTLHKQKYTEMFTAAWLTGTKNWKKLKWAPLIRGHATFRTLQGHFCQGANNSGRLRLSQCSFIKTLEACQLPLLRRDPSPCWRPGLPAESAALARGPGESLSPPHSFWEGLPAFSEPSHARWQGQTMTRLSVTLHSSVLTNTDKRTSQPDASSRIPKQPRATTETSSLPGRNPPL